jgi:hypothetical protein
LETELLNVEKEKITTKENIQQKKEVPILANLSSIVLLATPILTHLSLQHTCEVEAATQTCRY